MPNSFWIYGKHATIAAIKTGNIYKLWVTETAKSELLKLKVPLNKLELEVKKEADIIRVVGKESVHQGFAALVDPVTKLNLKEFLSKKPRHRSLIIALDHITDPHNTGSIIRSAVAFNCSGLLILKNHSIIDSAVVAKVASGGLGNIDIIYAANLVTSLEALKKAGYWIVGLTAHTDTSIGKLRELDKVVLVIGAEGSGLRRLTIDTCDFLLKIPINPLIDSLNVSNAAAIAMYEFNNI